MIHIPASILRSAFAPLNKCIGPRTTLPVLSHFRVERVANCVTLTATNLDQWLTLAHEVEPMPLTPLARNLAQMRWKKAAEVFLVPRTAIRDALKGAKTGMITLAAGSVGYDLAGQPVTVPFDSIAAVEFPQPPKFDRIPVPVPLDLEARNAILGAMPSMSTDDTRYILNGVLLSGFEKDRTTPPCVVATDGRRLSLHRAAALIGVLGDIVVPSAALELFATPAVLAHEHWSLAQPVSIERVPNEDKELEDREMRNHVHFTAGPWSLTTKLIEGNFPNYRQVIPNDDHGLAIPLDGAPHAQLCAILDRLPPIGDKRATGLGFHPHHLELRDESSKISATVAGVHSALPITAAFDRHYLRDGLRLGPGVIRIEDEMSPLRYDTDNATYVLMPMRGGTVITVPDPDREAIASVFFDKRVTCIQHDEEGYGEEGTVEGVVRRFREIVVQVKWPNIKQAQDTAVKFLRILEDAPAEDAAPEGGAPSAKPKAKTKLGKPKKGKRELQAA